MAHPHPDQRERFWEISYCTFRDLKIANPFWTYCHNFGYRKKLPEPGIFVASRGWVYASGLYEGYVRIPGHGDSGPVLSVPCTCLIYGRRTDRGIRVVHADNEIGFCTNRHYLDWWKK